MAGKFSIEGVFSVQDRASRVVGKIENRFDRAMRSVAAKSRAASARMSKVWDAAGKGLNAFQERAREPFQALSGDLKTMGTAAVAATAAAGAGLVSVMKTGWSFDKALLSAGNKFEAGISRNSETFKQLSTVAQKVGGSTEFSATQAAGGLKELAGAGLDAQQAIAALPGTVNLATAAEMHDMAAATEIAVKSLGAFGLKSKEPLELAKNLERVSDVLVKTDDLSSTSVQAFFEAIAEGGAVAKTAGADIETYGALVAGLSDIEQGGKAGTTLKNLFLTLSKPTKEGADALKRFGVETKDSMGNTLDAIDVLKKLNAATSKLGTGDKAGVLEDIFGKIPLAGVMTLKDKVDEVAANRDKLRTEATGSVSKKAASMRSGGTGAWDNFTSGLEAVSLAIFEVVGGPVNELINSTTEWVGKFKDQAIPFVKEFVGGLRDGFNAAWPAIKGAVDMLFTGFGGKAEWLTRVKDFATTLGKVTAAAVGVAAVLGGMVAAGIQIVTGVVNTAIGAWNGFINVIGGAVFAVDDFLANVGAKWRAFDFAEWGQALVRGLVNGIKSGVGWVTDAIDGLAQSMINKFKSALMIHSPSRKMAELGGFAAEGVAVGWDSEMPAVNKGIERSIAPINALSLGMESALGSYGFNAPSLGSDAEPQRRQTLTPQVVPAGLSSEEVGAAVRDQLEITIRDESGRAEVTQAPARARVRLAPETARSGAS